MEGRGTVFLETADYSSMLRTHYVVVPMEVYKLPFQHVAKLDSEGLRTGRA